MKRLLLQIGLAFMSGAPARATTAGPDSTKALQRAAHALLSDIASPSRLDAFVEVAIVEETPRVPAALLVSLAWAESRFEPTARPACGVMQVFPRDLKEPASACKLWREDLRAGVRAGVREIEVMLGDGRVRGDLRRALLYRACGNSAFDGTCGAAKRAWVSAAITRWRALETHARRQTLARAAS